MIQFASNLGWSNHFIQFVELKLFCFRCSCSLTIFKSAWKPRVCVCVCSNLGRYFSILLCITWLHHCVKTLLQAVFLCAKKMFFTHSTFSTFNISTYTPHLEELLGSHEGSSNQQKRLDTKNSLVVFEAGDTCFFPKHLFSHAWVQTTFNSHIRLQLDDFPQTYGILTTTSMRSPGMLGDFQPYKFNKITGTCQVLEGFLNGKIIVKQTGVL